MLVNRPDSGGSPHLFAQHKHLPLTSASIRKEQWLSRWRLRLRPGSGRRSRTHPTAPGNPGLGGGPGGQEGPGPPEAAGTAPHHCPHGTGEAPAFCWASRGQEPPFRSSRNTHRFPSEEPHCQDERKAGGRGRCLPIHSRLPPNPQGSQSSEGRTGRNGQGPPPSCLRERLSHLLTP